MHPADIDIDRFDSYSGQITVNGQRYRLVTSTHGPIHLVEVDGVTHRVSRDEGGVVRSPAPALVVATPVSVGDEVEANAPILVLESMKMETVLRSPFRARVRELPVSVGSQVETGAGLLRLEPLADEGEEAEAAGPGGTAEIELPAEPAAASAASRAERGMQDLRSLLLGFDVDPHDQRRTLAGYLAARAELGESSRPLTAEVELLQMFADLSELTRNKPAGEDISGEGRCTAPVSTSTPTCRASTWSGPGCRRRSRAGCGACWATTASRAWSARRSWRRRSSASSWPSSAPRPTSRSSRRCCGQWLTEAPPAEPLREEAGLALEHLVAATQVRYPSVSDLARGVVFRWFAQPLLRRARAEAYARVRENLRHLDRNPDSPDRAARIAAMVAVSEPLVRLLGQRIGRPGTDPAALLEVMTRRYYGSKGLSDIRSRDVAGCLFVIAEHVEPARVVTTAVDFAQLADAVRAVGELAADAPAGAHVVADIYVRWAGQPDADAMAARLGEVISGAAAARVRRPDHHHRGRRRRRADAPPLHLPPRRGRGWAGRGWAAGAGLAGAGLAGFGEDRLIRGLHPRIAERMQLERLREFDLTRLPSADEEVYLFQCVAQANPADERLVAMAQVRDLTPLREADGRLAALPAVEDALAACLDAIRIVQAQRPAHKRFDTNRIVIYVWPPSELTTDELTMDELDLIAQRVLPTTAGAGLEEVLFLARRPNPETGELSDLAVTIRDDVGAGVHLSVGLPSAEPVQPLDDYRQKVLRAARRGTVYPYELTAMLAGEGSFVEHDLDDAGALVPVDRPRGRNKAAIVAGVVSTPTTLVPEGVERVVLLGDPTKALGALSEPECARVIAALDLAERKGVPLEWFALSAGARISMDSGTENMDWVAAALKRIVGFTQAGGEINIVVAGINVGAQPYWNAEATMLMHTKGILVMTPESAMVLTGKQSLDFSGGVSAEDNFGIGGYDRVMGPNGQAQYWAPNLAGARDILMAHYDHTYVVPGESAPRQAATTDPAGRDVSGYPHADRRQRLHHGGPDLLGRAQPGPEEAVRYPHGDARAVRPGPPGAGALGGHGGRGHGGGAGRAYRRPPGVPARHRVPLGAAPRLPAHRRPGHLHGGHAVPALVEEGGARDQRGQRQPPAGGAGQPVGLRRLAGVDAQAAAGVRRGDRPGHRQLRRPDRVHRDLPLPRRRVRGVLQGAEPGHDGARPGGLVRLRARRRPRRGGRVRRRGQHPHRERPAGDRRCRPAWPR